MLITSVLLMLFLALHANAHSLMYAAAVNSVIDMDALRPIADNNSPVSGFDNPWFTCNQNGDRKAKQPAKVKPGDSLTFIWKHSEGTAIADSHIGPVSIMMGPLTNDKFPKEWFKVMQFGYQKVNGKNVWGTQLVMKTGRVPFTVPEIKSGVYTIRVELIAFHQKNEAQHYMRCMDVDIESTTNDYPSENYLKSSPAEMFKEWRQLNGNKYFFNIYNGYNDYVYPGPPAWKEQKGLWDGSLIGTDDYKGSNFKNGYVLKNYEDNMAIMSVNDQKPSSNNKRKPTNTQHRQCKRTYY